MECFADDDDVVLQLPDPVIVEQRQFQKTKGAKFSRAMDKNSIELFIPKGKFYLI